MNWLDRIERKFGRWAIPNLMYYIIGLNALIYIMRLVDPTDSVTRLLALDPFLVLQGQVWRLVTFIFIPPYTSPLFIIFTLYFYYLVGVSLEQEWGSFRFNLYYGVGMLATITAAFIAGGATGIYLNLSLFLAFAYLFPNFEIMLFMILPLKVKYLAIFNWIWIGYTVLTGPLAAKLLAVAAVVNFLVFFGKDLITHSKQRKGVHDRRKHFLDEIRDTPAIHRCAVCGITEKVDPRMDFAYCKICGTEDEYCREHIHNHPHVGEK